ncbi:gamma subclass chorismate mutase AroQ [Acinetobacter boissieri]|uniref:chorismate mutase n=1 Tax=Acinetobacter boissieri TaxID=1219383 RepID=A0A1G6GLS9_9GAMM|nr:gamma subclass chorismate mutase AroQ [Acinetobacter boissieri]SDB82695.1 chorismate mutase [Acinetobacter boissieri]
MPKHLIFFCSFLFSMNIFAHTTPSPVFERINQRLALMPDVAANKYLNHQPVEVLEQEQKVLEKTLNIADAEGLDPNSVKPFIVAQMNVAKAIQYRYIADWLSEPNVQLQPDTLNNVRDHISSLTVEMMKEIAISLKMHTHHTFDEKSFMHQVQFKHFTLSDQHYLLSTLQKIELKKATPTQP